MQLPTAPCCCRWFVVIVVVVALRDLAMKASAWVLVKWRRIAARRPQGQNENDVRCHLIILCICVCMCLCAAKHFAVDERLLLSHLSCAQIIEIVDGDIDRV